MTRFGIAVFFLSLLLAPAAADELPTACPQAADAMAGMGAMDGSKLDAAHQELTAGMDQMNTQMMAGSTAADIDVAFICAMIPHHQGAIEMAKAELAYGDDPWAKQLAQNIITAQTKEIAEMTEWLGKQPK